LAPHHLVYEHEPRIVQNGSDGLPGEKQAYFVGGGVDVLCGILTGRDGKDDSRVGRASPLSVQKVISVESEVVKEDVLLDVGEGGASFQGGGEARGGGGYRGRGDLELHGGFVCIDDNPRSEHHILVVAEEQFVD